MYDIIGDIHGYSDALEELLSKMEYKKINGVYSHPKRKALFLGDYIDRGPKIRETLKIVYKMVRRNQAIALMGNHEYNAICFHSRDPEGGHLRSHYIKNIMQHHETLKQFHNRQMEYNEYIQWFKTLPLFFENESFRAVHACWNQNKIQFLRKKLVNDRLNDEMVIASTRKSKNLNKAVDLILKGVEIPLPKGNSFTDKDGTVRDMLRIKWWENPQINTYQSLSIHPIEGLPDTVPELTKTNDFEVYSPGEKIIFFGHYWLLGKPCIYRSNICCLDYSIAKKGHLAAYRYQGESELTNDHIVYV